MTWTLKGFVKALENVSLKALEFHNNRGDFESWAQNSLQNDDLAKELTEMRTRKLKGKELRRNLLEATKAKFDELNVQTQAATHLF